MATEAVFARIAEAKPRRLLVIADGPRSHVPGDAEKCRAVRRLFDRIDWDCDLSINFADTNLGCRKRISSGLDWVFAQSEEAIILEDDCLPVPSFFWYCDELLQKYRDEPRVMTICGSNWLRETPSNDSYVFTTHCSIWGWATWRRAWRTYDVDLKSWPAKKLEDPFRRLPLRPKEVKARRGRSIIWPTRTRRTARSMRGIFSGSTTAISTTDSPSLQPSISSATSASAPMPRTLSTRQASSPVFRRETSRSR
jgi:hypothetical protein